MALTVKIGTPPGEVDRRSLINQDTFKFSSLLHDRANCDFQLTSPDGSYRPVVGHHIMVEDGATFHFGGYITSVEEVRITPGTAPASGTGALRYQCTCGDYNTIAERFLAKKVYLWDTPANIVSDLRLFYLNGDGVVDGTITSPSTTITLAIDASQTAITVVSGSDFPSPNFIVKIDAELLKVTSKGTGSNWTVARGYNGTTAASHLAAAGVTLVVKAVFDFNSCAEAFDQLALLANRDWYISNRILNFIARSTNSAPFSLTDAGTTFMRISLRTTIDQFNDRVYLRFAFQAISPTVETFTGTHATQPTNGSRKSWTLAQFVASETPIVKVNTEGKSVGVRPEADDPGKDWYWSYGENTIDQAAAAVALAATDTLEITYRKLWDDTTLQSDTAVIAARAAIEGGSGIWEQRVERTDIADRRLADTEALALLRRFSQIPQTAVFDTDQAGLRAGQLITINLTRHAVNGTFLIEQVDGQWVGSSGVADQGFLRYTARAHSTEVLDGVAEFFEALAGGGRGGGGTAGAGGSGVAIGNGVVLYQQTLTANFGPIAVPSDADGSLILWLFVQGGLGNFTVTWNAAFKSVGSWQPDPTVGKYSLIAFVKVSATVLVPAWAAVKGMG